MTYSQVKQELRINHSDDDAFITSLIGLVTSTIERYCHITMFEKTIEMTADLSEPLELPYGPVSSIYEAKYLSGYSSLGAPQYQTIDATAYTLDGVDYKVFYPGNIGQRYVITYAAGYSEVPYDLQYGIIRAVAYCYAHRGDEGTGFPDGWKEFVKPFKRMAWL